MEAAKRLAVVEVHPAVGHIQGIQRCRKAITEVFANREIERGVLWQMVSRIGLAGESVTEAGTVIDVGGRIRVPRQGDVRADVKGVALIVVEGTEAGVWIAEICGEIRKTSVDGAASCNLIGVGKVDLSTVGNARRAEGQLPAADFGSGNGDRQTQARSNAAMVKIIVRICLEVVDVENPSAIGDCDTELMFFVALPKEWEEAAKFLFAKLFQRTRHSEKRRCLEIVAVEGAEGPIQAGDVQRCAEARADGVLGHPAAEVRGAHSRSESQP